MIFTIIKFLLLLENYNLFNFIVSFSTNIFYILLCYLFRSRMFNHLLMFTCFNFFCTPCAVSYKCFFCYRYLAFCNTLYSHTGKIRCKSPLKYFFYKSHSILQLNLVSMKNVQIKQSFSSFGNSIIVT